MSRVAFALLLVAAIPAALGLVLAEHGHVLAAGCITIVANGLVFFSGVLANLADTESAQGAEQPDDMTPAEEDAALEHSREIAASRGLLPPPWSKGLTQAQRDHLPVVRTELTKAMRGEEADLPLVAQFLDELAQGADKPETGVGANPLACPSVYGTSDGEAFPCVLYLDHLGAHSNGEFSW